MTQPLADTLAAHAAALRFEDLPPAVVHEAKRRVLDSIGCALGAWSDEPCVIARRVASDLSAKKGATLWGTDHAAPPDWAAFANGILVRYLDYNDTYLSKEPAHPSDNIPAAIAAAQAAGASGRELIAAIVLAYEVQCRLCDAASLRAIGWDHVTYGAFSTAAAAAKLMKLDAAKIAEALGIAGVASAALRQSRVGKLSHWKGAAFANAARHGVFAAMLAAAGMTGPSPIFEGEKGFEKLVSGPLQLHGLLVGEKEQRGLMILRTSIKCWPVEYHAQSAVQAALEVRAEALRHAAAQPPDSSPDSSPPIQSVLIESHDASVDIIGTGAEKWRPATRETADHSLPYIVAAALMDGQITAESFSPQRFTDPKLLAFLPRVQVQRNVELSARYPGSVGNIVTATLANGREISKRVDDPLGHARNPMTDAQVADKFHRQADPLLGRAAAEAVADWVNQLESQSKIDELFPLLRVGGKA
ncbi:MAG TPA: MmgE/PrpD family protein [Tepidisphaeraceae bacterium]|jgi:2-methylcitrate dehydratase|nr:MmgE/PrpD family protein [Tepidisphaeraceae bacterium]